MTAWRRHLHQHPELSFAETETAAYIAERLREMGYAPQTGVAGTGVVAVLEGSRPGPTVALRADIDALPVQEATGLPFASARPGVMHACGHDAHTAILLGAARALREIHQEVAGQVRFLFQPAEEMPPGGAKGMIEAGVLNGVDAVFGLHVGNFVPVGKIGLRTGPFNASADNFRVVLHGKGGHAAYPQNTVDPIAMLGAAISALQHIASRMINPVEPVVLTIGWVRGGDADNIIPNQVEFGGTIRATQPYIREQAHARLKSVMEGIAATFGGRADVTVDWGYPALINDAAMTDLARKAAAFALGPENVIEPPLGMGGEDFAYFAQACPGSFARLGTGAPETAGTAAHSPTFVISEDAFAVGLAYYISLVLQCAQDVPGRPE